MSETRLFKNTGLGALLAVVAVAGFADSGAFAMARGASPATVAPAVASASAVTDRAGGDYRDGYALGQRNGSILVDRLKQRTTDLQGCAGIPQLESALLRVTRTIRPARQGDDYVAGFYSGYLATVRETLSGLRRGCDSSIYSSGEFAGQFYGAVACQVRTFAVDALLSLDLQPLYSGWSGGSSSVQESCRATLTETVRACTSGGEISADLDAMVRLSCSDSVFFE